MGKPRKGHRDFTPKDADRVLLDPRTVKNATNIVLNSIHRRCDARTRGADRLRQVDLYRQSTHEQHQGELAELLELPIEEFRARVPVLRETTIKPGEERGLKEGQPGDLFVEEWVNTKKPRTIAIPTAWADCIYRAFDEALQKTSNHLIPSTARAYRRGQSDAVHGVLWDASRAVRQGAKYWTVLDIKSFFPSMDHGFMKKTLEELGYSRWFVERVLSLIQGTVLQEDGQKRVNTKGCPPGLRMSGTLANLFLRDLDILLEKTFGARVLYRRYSDDVTLVAQKRHEVVGAVKLIKRWLAARALGVKGGWSRMSPESLVHNIEKRPLDVLGARMLQTGEIVMMPEKAAAFRGKFLNRAKLVQKLGPIIAGVSQYASWKGPKGRHAYDGEDLQAMLDQVEQYWGLLNGPLAKEFSVGLRRESGVASVPVGQGLTQTWISWIPGRKRHLTGGANRVGRVSAEQLLGIFTQLVQTQPLRAPSGPCGVVSDLISSFCGGNHSTSSTGCKERDLHWDFGRKPDGTRGCRGEEKVNQNPSFMEGRCDDTHRCTGTLGSPSVRLVSDPSKDQQKQREKKDHVNDLDQISEDVDRVRFGPAQAGAVGSPPPSASPLVIEVRVEGQPRRGAPRTEIAVLRPFETVRDTYSLPAQSALVEALRAELARAQALGFRVLVIRTPMWFPKALVKSSSRFHGVSLFDRILGLHREVVGGETELVLVGVPELGGVDRNRHQVAA